MARKTSLKMNFYNQVFMVSESAVKNQLYLLQ